MSTLFKDLYSESFYDNFAGVLKSNIPAFNTKRFKKQIFTNDFANYELKQRMLHTAVVLRNVLPEDFATAVTKIQHIIDDLRDAGWKADNLEFMFFPEYIALYGIDDFERSIAGIEFVTQFTSCEFAVRPFIVKYENKMLKQMLRWSKHQNPSVRRLASEGCRPRLPWAMALPALKRDPRPILPILENLKQDGCETVRRSVANNLNDISKDNPQVVVGIAKKWQGGGKHIDALLKHACRTLLKQGDSSVLRLFGLDSKHIKLSGFKINTPKVRIGSALKFSFTLENKHRKIQTARIEYALYYKRKNGGHSKKVFKISERELEHNKRYTLDRQQSFRPITTRRYYPGDHALSIIVNGRESDKKAFELVG